jgi:hypothetical protein
MNIYTVEQNGQYETYDFLIVVAKDEYAASITKPEGDNFMNKVYNKLWGMCNIGRFTVTLIGEALPGVNEGCLFEGKGKVDKSIVKNFLK